MSEFARTGKSRLLTVKNKGHTPSGELYLLSIHQGSFMLFQGPGLIFLSDCIKNGVNVVDGVRGSVCFEAKLPPSGECEAATS